MVESKPQKLTTDVASYEAIIEEMSRNAEVDAAWLRSDECAFLMEEAMKLAPPEIRQEIEIALNASDEAIKATVDFLLQSCVFHDGAFRRVQ